MKVYISVDIEGITGVTSWSETDLGHRDHIWSAEQMVRETRAACEAALEMGATEIIVKDAHDSARNMDISKLPREAKVIKGWTSSPESMMAGIDSSFDAVIFIGYHSAAGRNGNPLSHTMNNQKCTWLKINDELASEFTINTLIAAYHGVPVVFLSGDEMLCEDTKSLVPQIETVAVKKGVAGATFNIHPDLACELIKEGVKKGLGKIKECEIEAPKNPKLEIRYKNHEDANKASYYPGAQRVDDYTVEYQARDVEDLIRARLFIL